MYKTVLLLLVLVASLSVTGCVVGVKENNQLLLVSPVPIPESAKGVPLVGTNDKIPLVILGQPDKVYYQKVTGYVLVDPWTWEEMVKVYNDASR